jgi:transcriptional regulator with XRE-family HTH domain
MTRTQRRRALEAAGYTGKDVAQELGLAPSSVNRVMNGQSFSLRIAQALADRCGVTVQEMFPKAPARALRTAA